MGYSELNWSVADPVIVFLVFGLQILDPIGTIAGDIAQYPVQKLQEFGFVLLRLPRRGPEIEAYIGNTVMTLDVIGWAVLEDDLLSRLALDGELTSHWYVSAYLPRLK